MFDIKKINILWIGIVAFLQVIYIVPGIDYLYQDLKLYLAGILIPLIVTALYLGKIPIKVNKAIFLLFLPLTFDLINNIFSSNRANYFFYNDLNVYIISLMYAFIYILYSCENHEVVKIITKLIISMALLIVATAIILSAYDNHNQIIGKIYTGNQNLSSIILLISMPLLCLVEKNFIKRLAYFILIIGVMGLLIKNRFPVIIALGYVFYEIINSNRKYKFTLILVFISLLIATLLLNDRFHNLITSDIYIRLNSWLRLLTASLENLYFGYGLGTLSIVYNFHQYINPQTEILLGGDTFFFAHNQSIDKLISGGLLSLLIYYSINGLIIFKGIFLLYKRELTLEIKQIYLAYVIFLLVSQYDINSNYIGSNIWFLIFQVILLSNLFREKILIGKNIFIISFLILYIPFLIQFGFGKYLNNHYHTYNLMISKVNSKMSIDDEIKKIENISPHFGSIDTINAYNYLFTRVPSDFDSSDFEILLKNSQKYNRYDINRFRISTQYYATKNLSQELIAVYEDVIYKYLVKQKIINVKFDRNNLKISLSNSMPTLVISGNSIIITLPVNLFEDLKLINASKGQFELPLEVIDRILIDTNKINQVRLSTNELYALREFYSSINDFSKPLVFNK